MTRRCIPPILAAACLLALALPGIAGAKARDRNHDRIPDRWEKRHRLSLRVNQAKRDQDHDGLRNRAEFEAETNPRDRDSDDDGIPDGEEHAGTIASFNAETGMLTIDLFGGGAISGLVGDETEIECDATGAESSSASSSEDDEGDEEDQSEGEAGDGEDQGEQSDDDGAEEGSGEGDGAGSGGPGAGSSCTAADLLPGTTVDEAELKLENGIATFEKVELAD
jgi:hypothetical protein